MTAYGGVCGQCWRVGGVWCGDNDINNQRIVNDNRRRATSHNCTAHRCTKHARCSSLSRDVAHHPPSALVPRSPVTAWRRLMVNGQSWVGIATRSSSCSHYRALSLLRGMTSSNRRWLASGGVSNRYRRGEDNGHQRRRGVAGIIALINVTIMAIS